MYHVATIVAYFNDEAEAKHILQQLALETSVQSISFLNHDQVADETACAAVSFLDSLGQFGFSGEQSATCLSALSQGKAAVVLEGGDAADLLIALQNYGVREYNMV